MSTSAAVCSSVEVSKVKHARAQWMVYETVVICLVFKLFDVLCMDLVSWDWSFNILNRIVWWNHIACVWWSQSPRSQRNLVNWTSYSQSSWSSIRASLLRFFLFDPDGGCHWTSYSQSSWSSIRASLLQFFLFDPDGGCRISILLRLYRPIDSLTRLEGILVMP